jgi:hypothetical protein
MSWRAAGRVLLVSGAVWLAGAPPDALAQRSGGEARVGAGASRRGGHHQPSGHSPGGRAFAHRPFRGGIVVFAPPLWYGSDFPYGSNPSYGPAPVYVPAAGGTVALGPQAPPMPGVVQYPTGRWELRGDGLTAPYRWVWIPNPPSAPPASMPPAGEPMSPTPPASSRPEPPGNTRVYRWTDGQGVLHLTDRLETIPERYRSGARAGRPS